MTVVNDKDICSNAIVVSHSDIRVIALPDVTASKAPPQIQQGFRIDFSYNSILECSFGWSSFVSADVGLVIKTKHA
jgi:hypothetical protein